MALGIIISPAKKMNIVEGPPCATSTPQFIDRTHELLAALQQLSYDEAKALWRCSDRLAQTNYERVQKMDLDRNLSAAVAAHEGIQYQHLAAPVMDDEGLAYLEAHLRILSGFYGLLRPGDGVTPYRLEMQARLTLPVRSDNPTYRDLYAFWDDALARALAEEFDVVVNAASVEYAKAVTPHLANLGVRVISCLFGSIRPTDGRLLQRATEAKAARGTFVRWCAEQGAQTSEDLRRFNERGYRFDTTRSDEQTLVFVKQA